MGFTRAIRTCLRRYAVFSGRASRPEYWWFALFLVVGSAVLSALDRALFGATVVEVAPGRFVSESNGPLAALFALATLLPALSAGWRRMHDTGRSGLHLLYPLIAMIGVGSFSAVAVGLGPLMAGDLGAVFAGGLGIVMLFATIVLVISPLLVLWWLTRPSQPGVNIYGPNPREVTP